MDQIPTALAQFNATQKKPFVRLALFPDYAINVDGLVIRYWPHQKRWKALRLRRYHTLKNTEGAFQCVRLPQLLRATFPDKYTKEAAQNIAVFPLYEKKKRQSAKKLLADINKKLEPHAQFVPTKQCPIYAINKLGCLIRYFVASNKWKRVKPRSHKQYVSPVIMFHVDERLGQNSRFSVGTLLLTTFVDPRPRRGVRAVPIDGNHNNLNLNNWEWRERQQVVGPEELLRIKARCDSGPHGIRSQVARELGITKQHLTNILNGNGSCRKHLRKALALKRLQTTEKKEQT